MASLVEIVIKTVEEGASKAISDVTGKLGGLKGALPGLIAGLGGAAAAFAAVKAEIQREITIAAEAERVSVRLQNAWISTGRAAQESVTGVTEFSSSMMKLSTFDDEAINEAFISISKFESLPTDKMEQVVTLAGDMKVAFGGEIASNAEQIGRALETGVIPRTWGFSAALKAEIQAAQEAGDKNKALVLIMDELTRRYGGQGLQALNTYTGATDALKVSIDELSESAGGKYLTALTVLKLLAADAADYIGAVVFATQDDAAASSLAAMSNEELAAAIKNVDEQIGKADGKLNAAILAEAKLTLQTELSSRSQDRFGISIDTTSGRLGEFLSITQETAAAMEDQSEKLAFVNDYAAKYQTYLTELNGLEAQRAALVNAGWGETSAKVREVDEAIRDLKASQQDTVEEMVGGFMEMAAAADGIITEEEFQEIVDYKVATGEYSAAAADAAIKAWDLSEAIKSLPDSKRIYLELVMSGQMSLEALQSLGSGTSAYQDQGTTPSDYAKGGPTPPLFIAGDPGPFEEAIYAPGGAYVFTATQTKMLKSGQMSLSIPKFAMGNLPMEDQAIGPGSLAPKKIPTYVPFSFIPPSVTTSQPASSQDSVATNAAVQQAVTISAVIAGQAAVDVASMVAQPVAQSAETMANTGQQTVAATERNTNASIASSAALLSEMQQLRMEIKTVLPRAISDAYAKVVGS